MYYKELVDIYSRLENTPKRLEKVEIISELLKKTIKEDLTKIINLLQGKNHGNNTRLIKKII